MGNEELRLDFSNPRSSYLVVTNKRNRLQSSGRSRSGPERVGKLVRVREKRRSDEQTARASLTLEQN